VLTAPVVPRLGPADDPHAKETHGQHSDGSENNPEPSHDVLAPFLEGWRCPGGRI
jgi:hypothetical protein